MIMTSQDGVRRKLDFEEKPYSSKTFYLDIKTCKLKLKVTRRISELGGCVEEFLSKEIHLLITDKDPADNEVNQKTKTLLNEKKLGIPLSRGQALMMKAKKSTNDGQSGITSGVMDPLQKARALGVQIQLVSIFLKDSNKILHKVRQRSTQDEVGGCDMDGFSPLSWKGCDKENINVIKLEDLDQMYKPLIKYFDNFPQVRYEDDLISPFDKKIILHRKSETMNRYSVKRKSLPASKKGGFCEACNHWFKCSLREHLNSEKHKSFVDQCNNYRDLDSIIVTMPSVIDFLSKFPSDSSLKDTLREDQCKALTFPNMKRERNSSNTCLTDDLSLNLISMTSQTEFVNNTEQSKHFSGSNGCVDTNKGQVPVVASVNITMENGNNWSSPSHRGTCKSRGKFNDTLHESSEMDSEQTELYYAGSADESVTRDCDSQETKDSGTGPELVDDTSAKDSNLTRLCYNSDSALPLDLSTNLSVNGKCSNTLLQRQMVQLEETNCDNAVYPSGVHSTKVMLRIPETCRNKMLSFEGILKNTSINSTSENNTQCKIEGSQTKIIRNSNLMPMFSPLTSPAHEKPEQPTSFSQLTSKWLMDISTSYGLSEVANGLSSIQNGQSKLQNEQYQTHEVILSHPFCHTTNTAAEPMTTSLSSSYDNKMNQETPLDLTKASESSVARRLQYTYMDSVTSTDETSLLSLPQASENSESSAVTRQQCPLESDSYSYKTSGLSLLHVSENTDSSMSFTLRSENSCSSWSQFISEDSEKMSNMSSCSLFQTAQYGISHHTVSQDSPLPSDFDTPKALDDSVFVSNSDSTLLHEGNSEAVEKPSLKMRISLSGLKRNAKKPKRSSKKHSRKGSCVSNTDSSNTNDCISHVYVSCQQSDTKLKICKVAVTPTSQNSDLRQFWKVRKSGGCSLVFSSGKRKAERMDSNSSEINPSDTKRRRFLQFL